MRAGRSRIPEQGVPSKALAMPISFACPHCGPETTVAGRYAGQSGSCLRCGKPIVYPPPKPTSKSPILIIVLAVAVALARGHPVGWARHRSSVRGEPQSPMPKQPQANRLGAAQLRAGERGLLAEALNRLQNRLGGSATAKDRSHGKQAKGDIMTRFAIAAVMAALIIFTAITIHAPGQSRCRPQKPLTKSELLANVAAATELSKKQVTAVLEALTAEIEKSLGNKVRV